MIIELEPDDIAALLHDREIVHAVIPFGAVRLHSFAYEEGKFACRIDYPTAADVECVLSGIALNGRILEAKIEIPDSKKTAALLSVLTGIVPQKFKGMTIKYPAVKADLEKSVLPFVPARIEFLDDRIRIQAPDGAAFPGLFSRSSE